MHRCCSALNKHLLWSAQVVPKARRGLVFPGPLYPADSKQDPPCTCWICMIQAALYNMVPSLPLLFALHYSSKQAPEGPVANPIISLQPPNTPWLSVCLQGSSWWVGFHALLFLPWPWAQHKMVEHLRTVNQTRQQICMRRAPTINRFTCQTKPLPRWVQEMAALSKNRNLTQNTQDCSGRSS